MADTPALRIPDSPLTVRDSSPSPSPSPSFSPTPALSACPPLQRSVSAASTTSTFSQLSSVSRSSEDTIGRRRGFARPQGTSFADSARNRESVMCLGSIAHLQHYFARTGLLDGKGGQHYHGKLRKRVRTSDADFLDQDSSGSYPGTPPSLDLDSPYGSMRASPDVMLAPGSRASSEDRFADDLDDVNDPMMMLPPTVSTYNPRPKNIPPPPSLDELRRELHRSLAEAKKILQETAASSGGGRSSKPDSKADVEDSTAEATKPASSEGSEDAEPSQGWNELQGLNILDTMTLAIRAAKMYYTAHEHPARLASFKSERKLREDLLGVLDTLKRMAIRNFAGGVRDYERKIMLNWIDSVTDLLRHEEKLEAAERAERQSWRWMKDDEWIGMERDREWSFLASFEPDPCVNSKHQVIPPWTNPSCANEELPTPFLKAMQSGLRLVTLHNGMVRKSRKPFGQITAYHTDTMKPYRCADNLRYWIKAAELRWDIILKVDVMGVVYSRSDDAWKQFDEEIMRWCAKVRTELMAEWNELAEKDKLKANNPCDSDAQDQADDLSLQPLSLSSPARVDPS